METRTHQTIKLTTVEPNTKTLRQWDPPVSLSHSVPSVKIGSRHPYLIHSFYVKPFHSPTCSNHPDSGLLGLFSVYHLLSPLGPITLNVQAPSSLTCLNFSFPLWVNYFPFLGMFPTVLPEVLRSETMKVPALGEFSVWWKTGKSAIPGQCGKRSVEGCSGYDGSIERMKST